MTSGGFAHRTVLLAETVALLGIRPDTRVLVDATVGGGGHAVAMLEAAGPDARLLAVDRDPRALEAARARLAPFAPRVTFVHGAFGALPEHLETAGLGPVDALVADLGVSSPQLDDPTRGLSFSGEGPLDMRMDPTTGPTARALLDDLDDAALEEILRGYGEERRARAVARSILRARDAGELETTGDLRRAVVRVLGPKRGRIDPATRTFQALRLAVNRELDQLDALLAALPGVLAPDGVAAIISFHSLEDRRVKWAFRESDALFPLTKKPVTAGDDEARDNPRARSAKLRAARRLAPGETREALARAARRARRGKGAQGS